MNRIGFLVSLLLTISSVHANDALPIFDAHLHYSHDAWERISPEEVVTMLRKNGVRRAMVSSSSDEGTQRLYAQAPDLIVPSLRPYRNRGETSTWFRSDTMVAHLEDRLKRYKYAAIGEFHIFGTDMDLPIPRRMVQLAKEHQLFLHAHSDADAIDRIFQQDPNARVLWAHSGFDAPTKVREMLRKHKQLWADLAFRSDHGNRGKVDPEWRAAFMEFPDRFLVGTDTYTPERWFYVPEHARWSRQWLQDLPPSVAEQIAYKNGEALFGQMVKP